MVQLTLTDGVIIADGWLPQYNEVGKYTLRVPKTPEELAKEREARKTLGKKYPIKKYRYELNHNVIRYSEEDNRAFFFPGLLPFVKAYLKKNDIEYAIVADKRNMAKRQSLNLSKLKDVKFLANQEKALAILEVCDCGIIASTVGWGKSFIISVYCAAMDHTNIVVTTSSVQVVKDIYNQIYKLIPGEVGILTGTKNTTAGKRVIVTTLKSLDKIDTRDVDVILVDECHAVGANEAGAVLSKFIFSRKFGFSATPIRNDGSAIVMHSLLGPVALTVTYAEAVDNGMVTPMRYVMLHCTKCPPILRKLQQEQESLMKKFGYWCNAYRNCIIANFVNELRSVYKGQILIMTESVEHMVQLHMRLPYFVVAHYGATDLKALEEKFPKSKYPNLDLTKYVKKPKDIDIIRNAFAKGTLHYVISTKIFRQGVNFHHLPVIIRADGTVSKIDSVQIPGRVSRLDEGKDLCYTVDIDDDFHPWARARAVGREKIYKLEQWTKVSKEVMINDLGSKSANSASGSDGNQSSEELSSDIDSEQAEISGIES